MDVVTDVLLPDGWESPIPDSPGRFAKDVLGLMWVLSKADGPGNWTFTCRFGGRCEAEKRKTKKTLFRCKAFITFKEVAGRMKLSSYCWTHTHQISTEFLSAWLRPKAEVVQQIRDRTRVGASAADIRNYDARRPVLKERRSNVSDDLLEVARDLSSRWFVTTHYDGIGDESHLVVVTFVSRRFASSDMSRDILQIDDTVGTNFNRFILVNTVFQDENGKTQLLAFSVLRSKDFNSFTMALQDLHLS